MRRLPAIAMVVFLAGCSVGSEKAEMANPRAVYQIYSATYDASRNKTTAYARFRFGGMTGTNLELSPPARVAHSHIELRHSGMLGSHYVGEADGFLAEHAFEYTDVEGRVLANSVALTPVDFAPNPPASISRGKPLALAFAGAPVRGGETVSLQIIQDSKPSVVANASGEGATGVTVRMEDLARLVDGPAKMHWQRLTQPALQQATERGGEISGSYVTAARTVTLTK